MYQDLCVLRIVHRRISWGLPITSSDKERKVISKVFSHYPGLAGQMLLMAI